MTAFEKILLKTGEPRLDYIRRRADEGATENEILDEINSAVLFSGTPGKKWPRSIVFNALVKYTRKAPVAAAEEDPEPAGEQADIHSIELSAEEIAEVKAEAYRKVKAEQKKALRENLLQQEMDKLRVTGGQRTGVPFLDAPVTIYLDLPEGNNSIILNHKPYFTGNWHTVPRHVAQVMQEAMFRLWQVEARNDGKPVDFYTRSHVDRKSGMATFAERNEKVGSGDVGKTFVPGVSV